MSAEILEHQTSKEQAETEIRALLERTHRAHYDKDAAAIVAPYAEDAAVYDLAPPLFHRGMDPLQKKAWLDTWEGPIEFGIARLYHYGERGFRLLPWVLSAWRHSAGGRASREFLDAGNGVSRPKQRRRLADRARAHFRPFLHGWQPAARV